LGGGEEKREKRDKKGGGVWIGDEMVERASKKLREGEPLKWDEVGGRGEMR